jgi:ankyrin repeat protein
VTFRYLGAHRPAHLTLRLLHAVQSAAVAVSGDSAFGLLADTSLDTDGGWTCGEATGSGGSTITLTPGEVRSLTFWVIVPHATNRTEPRLTQVVRNSLIFLPVRTISDSLGSPTAADTVNGGCERTGERDTMPTFPADPDLDQLRRQAETFVAASVSNQPGPAFRMLTPELASFNIATAVVVGDAARVLVELERDSSVATRQDPRTGWTALHLACASRWHRDPARAEGLVAIARALLDGGASLEAVRGQWTALRCTAAAGNTPVARLVLDRGAVPEDHDLYLAAFANHATLALLLAHTADVAGTAEMALAAPISTGDTEAVRLLLEAGADPARYRSDGERPLSALYEAVASGAPAELVALLREHGAERQASETELFLVACLRADREGALARRERVADADQGAIVRAAEAGNLPALELMLELGFSVDACGDDGGTALHAAAYGGSPEAVRLLLTQGAGIEVRDTRWKSTPLDWALVGSGERPHSNPAPDWMATVRALIDAGASLDGVTLALDDPKPPSEEVAELLREYMR